MICPDAQGFIRQQRPYIFEQQLVLEDSPGQYDGVEAVFMQRRSRNPADPQQRLPGRRARSLPGPGHTGDQRLTLCSSGLKSNSTPVKGKAYASTRAALRANCSTHIAACPSKEISRVNPSRAATVSKRRPIEVLEKVRTPLVTSSTAFLYRSGKLKGAALRSGKESSCARKPAAACTGYCAAASPPGSAALRR